MVVKRNKKVRKLRGSHTHGYGSKKKHRGAGSRGGRGKAGMMKHKKSYMIKYEPNHFGRKGFKVPVHAKKKIKAINLKDIDIIAKRLNKKEINLKELGYQKVLAKGRLTLSLTIKADKFTEKAKEKIEKTGGKSIEL
jgi:large subunit ribosomal protein L15